MYTMRLYPIDPLREQMIALGLLPIIMADGTAIEQLRDRLFELNEQAQTIQAKADAEKRDLLEEEQRDLDKIFADFSHTEQEIERRERIAAQAQKLIRGVGRKTDAEGPGDEDDDPAPAPQPRAAGTPPRRQTTRIEPVFQDRGKWGWRNLGEFASAVKRAAAPGGFIDPRFDVRNQPTTYGSEDTGADGGFAVPPDFRTAIVELIMGETSLLGRTDQLTSTSNSITVPVDATTDWQTTGGIQAYWEGEGDQKAQSKPALNQVTIRLNKLAALIPVTDELLEDANALATYINRKAPRKIDFKVNLAIIQGNGVGQPLGIMNSPALVSVAKETSQPADTIVAANIMKMYSRMYAPSRANTVWLINQDIEPQLFSMQFAVKNVAGTENVGGVPVYLPANGLSGSPYATLFGRPVIPTQAMETLGDKGDILFADLSQYMTAVKAGGIRQDVSIHLWFDYDVTAFRFVLRVAGQPWWATTVAARDGSATYSPFVTLDERA